MRKQVLDDTRVILNEGGFAVSDTCNVRPKSFDVVARRGDLVLLVKALVNIDGLNAETAAEMKALGRHLGAKSLVVGVKTRDHELEGGVLYLRRGVPAVSRGTAYDYFVEEVPPLVYMGSGGLYASIDGDVLEDARDESGMSLGRVADELGVSRRSVAKYEDGMDATVDVAMRLEEVFDEELISPVGLFEEGEKDEGEEVSEAPEDEDERRVFAHLRATGFDVLPTERAPFRALSHEKDQEPADEEVKGTVLTGTSHHSGDVDKRARLMSSISKVAGTRSVYIVDSSKEAIEDTVLIGVEELREMEESEEFEEVYRERSEA